MPYGIAQLASVADKWGATVDVFDANMLRVNVESMRADLKEGTKEVEMEYDIFAFSGLVTTYSWQKQAIRALRSDWPDTFFIAGGGCASSLQKDMLKWIPELDAIALGEGENTLRELLELVEKKNLPKGISKVAGVMFREDLEKWAQLPEKPNKKKRKVRELLEQRPKVSIKRNPPRKLMTETELNHLPYPAWWMFDLEPRSEKGRYIPGYFANSPLSLSIEALQCRRRLDIISERGCPGRCRFCSHGLLGGDQMPDGSQLKPLVRWQSAEYVTDMIQYMLVHYKIDFIAFMDETFLFNKKRTHQFLDLLEEKDLSGTFRWGCLGRAEVPDRELLARLREGGCTYISYGFESSSQQNLDYLEKGNTVAQQEMTLKATIAAKINPITSYIIGYPDETLQSLYDTAKFWVVNGIVEIQPFFLTPYPYTRVYWENEERILAQYGGDKERFVEACGDATEFTVNLTKRFSDPEILGLRDLMTMHDLERIRDYAKRRGEPIVDPNPPQSERKTKIVEDSK